VVIEHPNYRARAAIDGRLRSALLADLASP
jgi:hypothetical protein